MEYFVIFVPLLTAFVSGLVTYLISKGKRENEREVFYETKIMELVETQTREIRELKRQIEKLTEENVYLREQLLEIQKNTRAHH